MDQNNLYSKASIWFNNNAGILLILVFYISEAANKYIEYTTGIYSIVPRFIKLGVMIVIGIYLFMQKDYKFFKIIFALLLCYTIGQYFLDISYSNNSILVLGRYVYPLILFRYFTLLKLDKSQKEFFFLVFENLIILNSILIFIGLIFDMPLFKTYSGDRFGYNGLLLTSSTSSYVYIITLFYFVLRYKSKPKVDYKLIIVLLACVFVGTKSVYLVFLATIFYVIGSSFTSKRNKIISAIIFFIICGCSFYFLFYKVEFFSTLREERGLLSVFLSFRDILLVRDLMPYINENWTFINYLFGGVHDISTQSEMGFIDLFYYWGIIGGILYLVIYYNSYFTFKFNYILWFFITALTFVIFIAGNFFFYSTIPIYLAVFRERIKDYIHTKTQNL